MNLKGILLLWLAVLLLSIVLAPKAQAQPAYEEIVLTPTECIQYAHVARKLAEHRDAGRSSSDFAFPNDSYLSLHEFFKAIIYRPDQLKVPPAQFERQFFVLCMAEPVGYLRIPNLRGS